MDSALVHSLDSFKQSPRQPGCAWDGHGRSALLWLIALFSLMIVGCSSSSGDDRSAQLPVASDDVVSDVVPDALIELQSDPDLLVPVPEVVASVLRADSGLQAAYTDRAQLELAPAYMIEEQWNHMQTCLEMTASAPVVLVRSDAVTPFKLSDDVVRNIDSTAISSSTLEKFLMQVSLADFDGSLGEPGFHLRSIMGRLLWLSASLPERDYPFHCSRL